MSASQTVAEFRRALAGGELLIQKCMACSKPIMYPRYACPFCQSDNLGWHKASGHGQLLSFTVLRMGAPEGFENDLPYALGVVRLEEGVQLLARLVPEQDGDWSNYKCDDPLAFAPALQNGSASPLCAWFKRAR